MKLPNCEVCGAKVARGKGYVCVDDNYAHYEYPKLYAEWKQAHIDAGNVQVSEFGEAWTGLALLDEREPQKARWRVLHANCDSRPSAAGYWFAVERCSTYAELLDWTAHLMDKVWLENTDWPDFLRRVVESQ